MRVIVLQFTKIVKISKQKPCLSVELQCWIVLKKSCRLWPNVLEAYSRGARACAPKIAISRGAMERRTSSGGGAMDDADCQRYLSKCVTTHLGVPDDDGTLGKFILSLYEQAERSNDLDRRASFTKVMRENGGDDFPADFVTQAFEIIDGAKHPIIKQEPSSESLKLEPTSEFAARLVYKGLSIPNTKTEPIEEKGSFNLGHRILGSAEVATGIIVGGVVTNLAPYGAFIKLDLGPSGLCHVSQISTDGRNRIEHPLDVLKLGQQVYVRVTKVEKVASNYRGGRTKTLRDKISLSMRGIDQMDGIDLSTESTHEHRGRKRPGVLQTHESTKRRLTSPERWEIGQLIASGALAANEFSEEDANAAFGPTTTSDSNGTKLLGVDEEFEVELNDAEPPFLQGQTKASLELNPVKIIKNPEGSLNRAAQQGSLFVKEFRDKKIEEQKAKDKKEKRELSRYNYAGLDPMAQSLEERLDGEVDTPSWKKLQAKATYGKRTTLSMTEQRQSLPVYAMRAEIVSAVKQNQFLVIVGETGSGKTTQIVQYLAEEGFGAAGKMIGCTQPRRVAAVSVAARVAEEYGCKVGQEVGYTIRFEDVTSPLTVIKYMTDGMLQKEALNDADMNKYSVIMLDEAHERTVATDILFAILKQAAGRNPQLKILVTSATLDSGKFSRYFGDCPIIKIPGRTFPVEIMYTREPELDYLAATLDTVVQIHISEPTSNGDILVFLTGQEEIDTSCEALFNRVKALGNSAPDLIILPVYSSLPSEVQSKIFEPTPPNARKCIFATNIAETSITIDGIYYVIDPGFVKVNAYDPKLGMDSLIVSPISQAQANQRSGRAGRTGPGKCYRLYTEQAFKLEMQPNTIPEIQRQNLSSTILMLKAMGINDLINFEFMDPPAPSAMVMALQELYTLEALDDEGLLTALGRQMANFPMSPALAKTLIKSAREFGCSDEILTIVAMLSVQTIFYRPRDKQQQADGRKARLHHSQGDHLTLLNVYRTWAQHHYSKQWCKDNYIQERSMIRAQEVRKQLVTILRRYQYAIVSCGMDLDRVRKALCSGFFKFSAKRDGKDGYKSLVEQTPVHIHPSSALFGKNPDYVIYHTLLLTTKEYMHCVTVIDPKWLVELAPAFFKHSDASHVTQRKKKEKIVPLFNKFSKDQNAWRLTAMSAAKTEALSSLKE